MKYTPLLHVVLHQPEIPQNTGNIGRTCVAVGAKLWLVRPLGFRLDEHHLRRAGLDYWQHLEYEVVDDWEQLVRRGELVRSLECASSLREETEDVAERRTTLTDERINSPRRTWFFTKTAARCYTSADFEPGDALVFGSETTGLPASMILEAGERALRLPMRPEVRSLNLGSCVAAAVYEAVRQISQSNECRTTSLV